MKIIRSYARKIPHEYYGGFKYATTDLFASYEQEIADALGNEKFKSMSDELYQKAKADVEEQAKAIIDEIKGTKQDENIQF